MEEDKLKLYAPVIIPTLNRFEHFKRCLESLERCTDAENTDIYVGLDFPPADKYIDGWKKIDHYLQIKEKKHGFKNLYVRRRKVNCGIGNIKSNSILLYEEVKQVSDRYILTEDDNEFSPDFLTYCNWGLEYFKDDDRIFAICGFNLIDTPDLKNNVYIYNDAYCAWGAAFLIERKERLQSLYDFDKIKALVDSYPLSIVFKRQVVFASSMLYMIKTKHFLGDTIIQAIPENKKWCVFPKFSMVRNWGHDGSGLHGGSKESYEKLINMTIDSAGVFEPHIEDELFTPEIEKAYIAKYGHDSVVLRIRSISRFIFYRITGRIVVLRYPSWLKQIKMKCHQKVL